MQDINIHPFSEEFIDDVVAIFQKELFGAFSAKLGENFFKKLYFPYFFSHKNSIGFIAKDKDKRVIGFILASQHGNFYSFLLKSNLLLFLFLCIKRIFKDPSFIFSILSMLFVFNVSIDFKGDEQHV